MILSFDNCRSGNLSLVFSSTKKVASCNMSIACSSSFIEDCLSVQSYLMCDTSLSLYSLGDLKSVQKIGQLVGSWRIILSKIYSSHSSIGNNVGDITSIPLTAVQMQIFILCI